MVERELKLPGLREQQQQRQQQARKRESDVRSGKMQQRLRAQERRDRQSLNRDLLKDRLQGGRLGVAWDRGRRVASEAVERREARGVGACQRGAGAVQREEGAETRQLGRVMGRGLAVVIDEGDGGSGALADELDELLAGGWRERGVATGKVQQRAAVLQRHVQVAQLP